MAVTWTKTERTNSNPLDGTTETVLEVNSIAIDDVLCKGEHLTCPSSYDDATIQQKVEAHLARRGYAVAAAAPSLAAIKGGKKLQYKVQVTAYIGKHYDQGQQTTLQALWLEGVTNNWANRKALVQSVLDWVKTVLDHFYGKLDEVDAAADAAAVVAVVMDLAQFDATDPLVVVKTVRNTVD